MEDDLGAGLRRMRLWLVTGSFLLSRMADGSELELEGVFVSVMIFYPNLSASLKCLLTTKSKTCSPRDMHKNVFWRLFQ